ncbi:hypothetical protein GUJ93_ZPchr0004g38210 [Zizania palustris]|uniref:Uncharacterized protein n=1 Tax=Zizania palustris TaxID=103762 RepID=A0A8J5SIJ5_ZIZPA|nr:hypothetical protein GUJ93_ZPchr0004g38210 [Zizania palustris]
MGCYWQRRRRRRSRSRKLQLQQLCWRPLLVLVLLHMVASSCQASRGSMQTFKGRPLESGASNHFLGFLPRGTVPPSGPSRHHNSVGLESQLQTTTP